MHSSPSPELGSRRNATYRNYDFLRSHGLYYTSIDEPEDDSTPKHIIRLCLSPISKCLFRRPSASNQSRFAFCAVQGRLFGGFNSIERRRHMNWFYTTRNS